MTKKYIDELSYTIIGCAIEVHKSLGPGLLEEVYKKCLVYELKQHSLMVQKELFLPIQYKQVYLETQMRVDLLVDKYIIVELKAVDLIHSIHEAQLLTYMKLMEKPKGILINFNCKNIFREGQKTFVNEFYSALPEE